MAYSNIKTPADGSTSTFSVPFPYLNKDHVHVFIDGVETFDFTWVTEATINLNTIPPAGSIVTIQRITPKNERNVDFQNGSALNPDNLDLDSNQLLYIMQENSDKADESLRIDTDNKWDAEGRVIKNVGNPVDDEDFLNKGVADQFLASVRASETNASISEDNARASEIAAKDSENKAKASEQAASISETNALASEQAAKASEIAAKASEINASNSEAVTIAKANEATSSASSALASKNSATTSETNAKASELAAKVSENNAYIYSKIAQDNALIIASSQLAQAIGAEDTSLTVLDGSSFPDAPFVVSVEDEIIEVGAKDGNTFLALVRGSEGTTPAGHPSGTRVENRFTAGTYQQVVDEIDAHKAESVSDYKSTTRDLTLTGVQTITGFNFVPERLLIFGNVNGTKKSFQGMRDTVNNFAIASRGDTGDYVRAANRAIVFADTNADWTRGAITINSDKSITITWDHVNSGATGTADIFIIAFAHGGGE